MGLQRVIIPHNWQQINHLYTSIAQLLYCTTTMQVGLWLLLGVQVHLYPLHSDRDKTASSLINLIISAVNVIDYTSTTATLAINQLLFSDVYCLSYFRMCLVVVVFYFCNRPSLPICVYITCNAAAWPIVSDVNIILTEPYTIHLFTFLRF